MSENLETRSRVERDRDKLLLENIKTRMKGKTVRLITHYYHGKVNETAMVVYISREKYEKYKDTYYKGCVPVEADL